MRTRRQLLRTGGLTAAAAVSQGLVHGGSPRANGTAPFRLLYSNDLTHLTSCVSPYRKSGEPFRPEHLEASVDEVAPYGVDVHLLQPGLGMVPLWPSQVLPLEAHYAWIKERYGQGPDPFGLAALQGIDLVQRFIDRCRSHGQRPFLSFRLNDAHHKEHADPKPGVKPGSSIGMSVTRFYAEHPEYRIKLGSSRAADVVWIGLSTPRQEFLMQRLAPRTGVTLIGVGAAFDFHTGAVRRAPRWMQKAGLESLFRLASDPRRLWRRYLIKAPRFVWMVATRRRQAMG